MLLLPPGDRHGIREAVAARPIFRESVADLARGAADSVAARHCGVAVPLRDRAGACSTSLRARATNCSACGQSGLLQPAKLRQVIIERRRAEVLAVLGQRLERRAAVEQALGGVVRGDCLGALVQLKLRAGGVLVIGEGVVLRRGVAGDAKQVADGVVRNAAVRQVAGAEGRTLEIIEAEARSLRSLIGPVSLVIPLPDAAKRSAGEPDYVPDNISRDTYSQRCLSSR